jgi:hypothetical protein
VRISRGSCSIIEKVYAQDCIARTRVVDKQHDGAFSRCGVCSSLVSIFFGGVQVFPMAVLKRVIPWWSLPLNFLIGILSLLILESKVTIDGI